MTTQIASAAETFAQMIVGQMNADDKAAIVAAGDASAWAEGVANLSWDEAEFGARPATSDVVDAIGRMLCSE